LICDTDSDQQPLQATGQVAGRSAWLLFNRAADSVTEAPEFWFARGLSPNQQNALN
jgi:hypothetical protein